MLLSPPEIVQPISVWTKQLLITGASAGAQVSVQTVKKKKVANIKKASGGWDWVDLLPGVTLQAGDQLQAMQAMGKDKSVLSSAVPVNAAPTNINELVAVTMQTFLWECGEYVWVTGAEPGATIMVKLGASTLGSADAPLGWATFHLNNKLSAPGPVQVWQKTPIGDGPVANVPVTPLPPQVIASLFPPPAFDGDLHACEDRIPFHGIYDGATLTLDLKNPAGKLTFGAAFHAWTVVLPAPLVKQQTVTASQAMPKCDHVGSQGMSVSVGPPDVQPPFLTGLCKGSKRITVFGLNPNALANVQGSLDANFQDLLFNFTVHGESWHPCDVAPLPSGKVWVVQEICHQTAQSGPWPINDQPAPTQKPTLITPLFACQRKVWVKDVDPGDEVQAWALSPATKQTTAISAKKTFLSSSDSLDVSPELKQDDDVWVMASGCGTSAESDHSTVKAHPPINPPTIQQPVRYMDTSVTVLGLIATASVYVYVSDDGQSWQLAGFDPSAAGTSDTVPLNPGFSPLRLGQQVAAAQYYCEITTLRGPAVKVVKREPLPPQLINPSSDQKDVPLNVTFSWTDPGAGPGAERGADSFVLQILQGGQVIHDSGSLSSPPNVNPTVNRMVKQTYTHTPPPGTLKIGTTYTWQVQGTNSTGSGKWASQSFTTLAPVPNLDGYDQFSQILQGHNFPVGVNYTLNYRCHVQGTITLDGVMFNSDLRDAPQALNEGPWQADVSGNVSQMVDLYSGMDPFQHIGQDNQPHWYSGPLNQEIVFLQAEYVTMGNVKIQSNWLSFPWTRANVPIN
jgi:hypothetical protein